MVNTPKATLPITLWLALSIGVSAHSESISGTYVGKGNGSAFLIQLVQTSDGHLTGRYSQISLQPNGKLAETNAAITGASDGHTIALQIKPTEILAGTMSLSGTIDGSLLHATGGGYGNTLTLNLSKSSEDEFQAAISELARQGELANRKRTIQEAIPRIERLTRQMAAFSAELPVRLTKFGPVEQQYRTITEKMRMGLTRQRSIYGDGQASVARGQLGIAINQAGGQATQLHLSVQSQFDDFKSQAGASLNLIAGMIKLCQSAPTNVGDDALVSQWQAACLRIATAAPDFQKHVTSLGDAFVRAERVWQEERPKQEGLIQSADSTP